MDRDLQDYHELIIAMEKLQRVNIPFKRQTVLVILGGRDCTAELSAACFACVPCFPLYDEKSLSRKCSCTVSLTPDSVRIFLRIVLVPTSFAWLKKLARVVIVLECVRG